MSLPWLLALKVIPWGDVIEHAPKVLSAARKLLARQQDPASAPVPVDVLDLPGDELPSLGELKNRLVAAQVQLNRQTLLQEQTSQTLNELAEQNARLVSTVELLRVRSRWLIAALVALALGLAWVAWN
ncbi:hypothetical protein [Hydrogenophaga sp.]|uniref:hypothetical protein n=1 Tax=Hydrogenophaga sp. TaxID=1904254 RepID=UPI0019B871F9|nr:hypothetical protein [Hydrogenophaga sp.]MBD3892810.1 hypothetical protein [Hydrogenophaga sp.]